MMFSAPVTFSTAFATILNISFFFVFVYECVAPGCRFLSRPAVGAIMTYAESLPPVQYSKGAIPMPQENPTPLTDDQITKALAGLPGWERDGDTIKKTYKLD